MGRRFCFSPINKNNNNTNKTILEKEFNFNACKTFYNINIINITLNINFETTIIYIKVNSYEYFIIKLLK